MTVVLPSAADRLAEAQLALHRLQIGQAFVEVSVNGYMTKFSPANRDALQSYIQQLQNEIAGINSRGAVGFVF